jgi:ribosomal protein S27E
MNRGPSNPLGLGLVIVGAAAMAIATFLPLTEPTGVFHLVPDNTLIQHDGWALIGFALAIAGSGFRASQRNGKWFTPLIWCILAAILIAIWFMDQGTRTLYPIGADGTPDTSQPGMVGSLGIALYVAAAGVGLALIGSLNLRQTEESVGQDPLVAAWEAEKTTKKCPDCAETILADAHVCKHCGYRFAPTAPDAPQALTPHGKSTKVKCHSCQHVQMVPLSQQTFACEECGTKLKRRTPVEGS